MIDVIFPPLCLFCKEGKAEKWFCYSCWELLAPANPLERCRHCFGASEYQICQTCRKSPDLFFARAFVFEASGAAFLIERKMEEAEEALAAFAFLFWQRLGWKPPDAVIPLPDEHGRKSPLRIAKRFAQWIEKPCILGLKKTYTGYLKPDLILSKKKLPEDHSWLLFDGSSTLSWKKKASERIADAFPKKAMILSLYE